MKKKKNLFVCEYLMKNVIYNPRAVNLCVALRICFISFLSGLAHLVCMCVRYVNEEY